MCNLVLVPPLSLLVLECSYLTTFIESLSLVEGGGVLIFLFWGSLEWPKGGGDLRSDLGSGGIAFLSSDTLKFWTSF